MSRGGESNDGTGKSAAERKIEATLIEISAIAHRVARKAVGRHDGADVAQDVVLECLIKLRSGEWKPGMRRIRPMVIGMVRKRAADVFRSGRRRQHREADYAKALPDVTLADVENPRAELELEARRYEFEGAHERALDTLPDAIRRVYVTVAENQSTHQAAADRLGVSRTTVTLLFGEAQRRVRQVLTSAGFRDVNSLQRDAGEPPHQSVQKQQPGFAELRADFTQPRNRLV